MSVTCTTLYADIDKYTDLIGLDLITCCPYNAGATGLAWTALLLAVLYNQLYTITQQ